MWCTPTSQVTGRPSFFAARTSSRPALDDMRHRWTRAPVARTSSKIVCRAMVSLITGTPDKPRRDASAPLWAMPPRPMWASWGRSQTVYPKVRAYCRARSSTVVSSMGSSAWAKPMQPASVSSAISVRALPFKPMVRAPSGCTWAWCRPLALCLSISTRPGSSSTGSVSGGHTRLVTPPATAAASSDFSMPSCSWPGSRRRTARSSKPGATTQPVASIVCVGWKSGAMFLIATTTPLARSASGTSSKPMPGSMTRPPLIRIFISGLVPENNAHHRHAHRNAKGHLRQDHALLAVHHGRVNFHTPVDRPRLHHDGIRFGQLQLFRRQAITLEKLLTGGQQRAAHTFVLQAQHDDDVATPNALFQGVAHPHAHLGHVRRHQGFGPHHPYLGTAEGGEGMNVGAGHARVQHIADDGHRQV